MSQFKPGDPRTKTGGRRKGSRDRIETKMLEAIARDFEEHGEEAIRICRVERPNEYLKLVASLLPREVGATIDDVGRREKALRAERAEAEAKLAGQREKLEAQAARARDAYHRKLATWEER